MPGQWQHQCLAVVLALATAQQAATAKALGQMCFAVERQATATSSKSNNAAVIDC